MQRVIVIGCGGAGKSTFSLKLGEALGLPVVHLDKLHWTKDWQSVDRRLFAAAQLRAVASPAWIIDGHYGSTLSLRIEAADTVILLDFPTWLCLYGVCRRWLSCKLFDRPTAGMRKGNPERLDAGYLAWVWNYRRTRREGVLEQLANVVHRKTVIALRSRADVKRFLRDAVTPDKQDKTAVWSLDYRP